MANTSIMQEIMDTEVDIENPQPRCIVQFVIDDSESMAQYTDQIQRAFPEFVQSFAEASDNIELGVWKFNRIPTELFATEEVYKYTNDGRSLHLNLTPHGRTHTGEAILAAMQAIDRRQEKIKKELNIPMYMPLLVIISDGNPQFTDDPIWKQKAQAAWEKAQELLHERVTNKVLQVIAIGVGNEINEDILKMLSGGGTYYKLNEIQDWNLLFKNLSSVVLRASQDYGMNGLSVSEYLKLHPLFSETEASS